MKKIYVTTALPYVNAAPHIGHALEFIQADVIARSRRNSETAVYFLSGSDENAIKNVQAAEEEGIPVEKLVERNAGKFIDLLKKLNVSNDQFIRTTEARHKAAARALWERTKKEDIYKKKYSGLYCVGCEAFYNENDLQNGECPEHPGKKLELVEEENYFFRLSSYSKKLGDLIESGTIKIIPGTRKNEILSLVRHGLEDFSISRSINRSKGWGVSVPNDETQTMYVWYDALTNYISALGFPADSELYRNFWASEGEKIHVIGKGITRFHALYWPAMLLSAGVPLPTHEFVHGYVTAEGKKMSKTIGNVVDPFGLIEKFGCDAVRYYFLREISPFEDGDYSEEKFRARYNGDLANGIGNFAARVSTLGSQCGNLGDPNEITPPVSEKIAVAEQSVQEHLHEFKFNEALASIWELIGFGDKYLNEEKPWKTEGEQKIHTMRDLLAILNASASLLSVFMPETSEKIRHAIQKDGKEFSVQKISLLFPRLQ